MLFHQQSWWLCSECRNLCYCVCVQCAHLLIYNMYSTELDKNPWKKASENKFDRGQSCSYFKKQHWHFSRKRMRNSQKIASTHFHIISCDFITVNIVQYLSILNMKTEFRGVDTNRIHIQQLFNNMWNMRCLSCVDSIKNNLK